MRTLNDIVSKDQIWSEILDTLLPGGENWQRFVKIKSCLSTCPGLNDCSESGPEGLVCSEDWREARVTPSILNVLRHALEYFDYYDRGDCLIKNKEEKVEQLLAEVNRHLDRKSRTLRRTIEVHPTKAYFAR